MATVEKKNHLTPKPKNRQVQVNKLQQARAVLVNKILNLLAIFSKLFPTLSILNPLPPSQPILNPLIIFFKSPPTLSTLNPLPPSQPVLNLFTIFSNPPFV